MSCPVQAGSAKQQADSANQRDLPAWLCWARTWNVLVIVEHKAAADRLIDHALASDTELAALKAACPEIQSRPAEAATGDRMHRFTLPDTARLEMRDGGLYIVHNTKECILVTGPLRYSS